ncbi:MAG: ribosome small subunit-dependent GTPase A, partial [Alphaproteobacteria bacterium]|nr:ribosome small subunit-dependent GTPase A [Alphaproteobacteria bacterium]
APLPAAGLDSATLATVIEVRGREAVVSLEDGRVTAARPSPFLVLDGALERQPLAVGDLVRMRMLGGVARLVAVEPRRSALRRHAGDRDRMGGGAEQVIAANVDQVVLVVTPSSPPFRPGLVDRYLVAAGRDGLPLLLCLNKADLGMPPGLPEWLDGYARLGIEVARTSAVTGEGVPALRRRLEGNISLLAGHSGVGKSSLLNALEPGLARPSGAVTGTADGQGKGTHTTTSARLIPLATAGTYVVDSPGTRMFGIGRMDAGELASLFVEVAAAAPACAVEAALSATAFGRHRLASYRTLLAEATG